MKIPNNWNEVTLEMFEDLKSCSEIEDQSEREYEQLAALTGSTPSDLKNLSLIDRNDMINTLLFTNEEPKPHFNRIIEIEGIKFGFITNLESVTLGEWIDLDNHAFEWQQDSKSRIAAVLWRPITKEDVSGYEIQDYDAGKAEQYAALFNKNLSYQDFWGARLFFYLIVIELLRSSKASLIL